MKTIHQRKNGSAILCAVLTLAIISIIAAGVLYSCVTRYNISSKQVKSWNEALYAAEAGADVGFAEIRKVFSNSSTFGSSVTTNDGWTAASPYTKSVSAFGQNSAQSASVSIDLLSSTVNGYSCYRIRSTGKATLPSTANVFRRTGMDDRLMSQADTTTHFANGSATRGTGDSLLRKIDINYDHFKATYGDGDGNSVSIQTVSTPQVSRRVETVAVPTWASTGALTAYGSFDGPGSAGVVDSFNSKNGAYSFVANNPASPYYSDATQGSVSVGTSSFGEGGPIYGNVTTNGGNVTHSGTSISGTIDNNVPLTTWTITAPSTVGWTNGTSTLTLPQPASAGATGTSASNPYTYVYNSSQGSLTINSNAAVPAGAPNGHVGKPLEVYVKIVVNGDFGDTITIAQGVNAVIYFTGNLSLRGKNDTNNNVDGAAGQYNYDGSPSTDYSEAGHLQYWGVNPPNGTTQTISLKSPGDIHAAIYAPGADLSMNGNPDIYGAVTVHNFSGNGNTGFHYDTQLAGLASFVTDYQIASYIEDIR